MLLRRTVTVSITAAQDTLLRACLQSGRYASTSEAVRAALRLLEREEIALQPAARPALVSDAST